MFCACGSHVERLPCGSSYLFIQHKAEHDREMSHRWLRERENCFVFFNPRPEQGRPYLEFKGRELLERLSHYSGIATSNVICLPADDRGPAVSD